MEGRILTLTHLARQDACNEQYDQFYERFDREVLVTVELAVSQALDWDWSWASQALLSSLGLREYSRRVRQSAEKYETAMEPLRAANRKRRRTAEAAFDESIHSVRYMEQTRDDWNAAHLAYQAAYDAFEYDQELHDSVQLEYAQVKARVFAEIYIKEGEK